MSALSLHGLISNGYQSIRMADPHHQRQMVQELLIDGAELEKLLRDPFANYVVQTAVRASMTCMTNGA